MLGQRRVFLHRLALGGCFGPRSNARLALAIERLSHRRRTAHLAQRQNLYLKIAARVLHFQIVTHVDLSRGLGLMPIGQNAAQIAGL